MCWRGGFEERGEEGSLEGRKLQKKRTGMKQHGLLVSVRTQKSWDFFKSHEQLGSLRSTESGVAYTSAKVECQL